MSPDDILSILQIAGSVEIDELDIDVKVEDWSITGSIRGLRIYVAENAKGNAADITAEGIRSEMAEDGKDRRSRKGQRGGAKPAIVGGAS